jgi:hypothetical protein
VEFASELEASLREFSSRGAVEVRENGSRVASLAVLTWEVRGAGVKPLLHLWSEQYNLTRRVLSITDHSDKRLALAVERFGSVKPVRLEFVLVGFERSAKELSRDEFCTHLSRVLAEQFPDESVESLVISPDLEHSLSGNYARGLLRRGSTRIAVLGVSDRDSPQVAADSLTFGLLWLDRARHLARRDRISVLRLILPKNASLPVAHCIAAVDASIRLELFEYDSSREILERVDPKALGNLSTFLVHHREAQALLDRAWPALDSILTSAGREISLHPAVSSREVFLRFRGLSFARWTDGRVFFGANDPRQELTPAAQQALARLMHDLKTYRHPLATDTHHSLYRAQPERWLESLVRDDVTRLDAALDPRYVYSQVFANAGGEHSILDLLGVTRSGRLTILELKASEHIHLPLQAADYWLRVHRHLQQGDFGRNGYFPGVHLQDAPPLVYLVAPALQFHPATDTLLRCLSRELEIVRVGLAESWRRGLRVVMRQ